MINFTPVPTVDLGFYKISTHGLLIAAGFLVAELLARREAKQRGLLADIVDNAAIIAVIAGLVANDKTNLESAVTLSHRIGLRL